MLHADGVLREPLLYLSLFLKQHRSEYCRRLDAVRTEGDWEAWLDFFLEGVETTATSAVDTAHRLLALTHDDAGRIQQAGRSAAAAQHAFAALGERPIMKINEVRRRRGISFPTASKGMHALLELGIARELTGKRRNRVFAYDRYLAILSDGTEPL